jgi:hypothetical protein
MATEKEMLTELIHDNRLSDDDQKAFQSMLEYLDSGGRKRLSRKQHEWVAEKHKRLELTVESSLNLHSSGKVPDGVPKGKTLTTLPWEQPGYNKPLRPPGKKTG